MKYILSILLLFITGATFANYSEFPNKEQLARIKNELPFKSDCIMADYESVHVPSQDKTYYEVLFWDTETGKSKLYFYSYNDKKFKAYEDNVQLPELPISDVKGKVMMDYTSVHVPSQDKTYYEALVWDSETGTSTLYFYSYDSKSFKAYEDNVQLPANPLGEASGSVMADYTSVHVPSQDKTYYEVMFWDTKTGTSKLYFYSFNDKKFKAYEDNVQLPSAPLDNTGSGTVMMDYTSVHVPSQDKTYYEVLVWNTQTGNSKLYFYSFTDKKFKAYEDNVQLPSTPLASSGTNDIMMDYTSVHVPSQDKTYYEVFVWNPSTGNSKLFFYSYDDKKFKAYDENVQLPSSPLGTDFSGSVQADYTSVHVPSQDKTYYEVLFWDNETGKSKLYFYSYDSKTFKAYEDNVQLTSTPIEK